jgi:hypothetical protein
MHELDTLCNGLKDAPRRPAVSGRGGSISCDNPGMATRIPPQVFRDVCPRLIVLAAIAIASVFGAGVARAQDARSQAPFPDDPLALVAEANKAKAQGK